MRPDKVIELDNRKINIAICLSGEPRYWPDGALALSKFVDTHKEHCNIDIFYHFWNDITKRQRHLLKEPVQETVDSTILQEHFNPTIGICESKDALNPHIDKAWEHVQEMASEYNITHERCIKSLLRCHPDDLEKTGLDLKPAFYRQIKTTNSPPFSQMITMCKSLVLMLDYAEENNIQYDVIIRSRSDVVIKPIAPKKIRTVVKKDQLSRYIKFPQMSTRTPRHKDPSSHTPYVAYEFFIGSSKTITKSMFKDYSKHMAKLLIGVKNEKRRSECDVIHGGGPPRTDHPRNIFLYNSSHNCVPLFFKNKNTGKLWNGNYLMLGSPCSPFSYNLVRPDTYDTTSERLWETQKRDEGF